MRDLRHIGEALRAGSGTLADAVARVLAQARGRGGGGGGGASTAGQEQLAAQLAAAALTREPRVPEELVRKLAGECVATIDPTLFGYLTGPSRAAELAALAEAIVQTAAERLDGDRRLRLAPARDAFIRGRDDAGPCRATHLASEAAGLLFDPFAALSPALTRARELAESAANEHVAFAPFAAALAAIRLDR